jgi:hypothetical protein
MNHPNKNVLFLAGALAIIAVGAIAYYFMSNKTPLQSAAEMTNEVSENAERDSVVKAEDDTSASSAVYRNTRYGYQFKYPSELTVDADVYGGSNDLTLEPAIYLQGQSPYRRFNIEVLDPNRYPSIATASLTDYVKAVHEVNDDHAVTPVTTISVGGKTAYTFNTDDGFNTYAGDKDGAGWVGKPATYIFVENDGQVLRVWFPVGMVEAQGILDSFRFL